MALGQFCVHQKRSAFWDRPSRREGESSFQELMAARRAPFPKRLDADLIGRQRVEQADAQKLVVLDLVLPSMVRRTPLEADCLARSRVGGAAVASQPAKRWLATLEFWQEGQW